MSFERIRSEKPKADQLKLRNALQLELLKRHCARRGEEQKTEYLLEVISPRVRALLKQNPALLEEYDRDPASAIQRIEDVIQLQDAEEAA